MKSNLDLVNDCDCFPYLEKDASAHSSLTSSLYSLLWEDGSLVAPVGYITEDVFNKLAKVPTSIKGELEVNRPKRTVTLFQQATEAERSRFAAETAAYWREKKTFKVLEGWRDELYPIYGPKGDVVYSIERAASALFGIITYGVHLTAFVRDPEASHGMKIWVPRRSATKQTYGRMLDNTVAGGMATGEDVLECVIRESEEEASIPRDIVKSRVTAHGSITYIHITSNKTGGETGLIQPECEYVYDLELPIDFSPKVNDSEVQEFYLWTVEEVQQHMAMGEFKTNCAVVLLDFFIRHGILTKDNEPDLDEIKARIHRDLGFPGPWRSKV